MRRISRPYAEALLGATESLEQASAVRDELLTFAESMRVVPELAQMAVSPVVPLDVKQRAFERVADSLELSLVARRFVNALLVRYRLEHLDEIVDGVTELLNRRLGVAVAQLKSAEALSSEDRRQLVTVLEAKVGKRIEVEATVDPSLLAGFVVQVGSTLWDASLRGQLDRLTTDLAQA